MDLTYEKLSASAIDERLATIRDWQVVQGALTKQFHFESYASGLVFAVAVAHVADTLNHHPDMLVGYKRVTVSMVTHDADGGLTAYDFELARRIDLITA